MKVYLMAATAGLCAGAWPLVMKPANLGGGAIAISYCVFSLAAALFLFVVVEKLQAPAQAGVPAGWWWAIAASILAAAALLLLSIVIPQVSREKLGAVYAVLILVQITVPVLYHTVLQLYEHHAADPRRLAGAAAALIAAYLLST